MQQQPDFTRRRLDAQQHARELQQQAERQSSYPDDSRPERPHGRFVLSAPLALGLIVLLLAIISCVGVLHAR